MQLRTGDHARGADESGDRQHLRPADPVIGFVREWFLFAARRPYLVERTIAGDGRDIITRTRFQTTMYDDTVDPCWNGRA